MQAMTGQTPIQTHLSLNATGNMVLKYKNNSINKISSRKFTSPGEHYLAKSTFSTIMPNTRRHSYDLNFKLKIVAEAEAVNNNRDIAREYGISESMVRKWCNQ